MFSVKVTAADDGGNVERHDGGEKALCIDGINTTIYYYEIPTVT